MERSTGYVMIPLVWVRTGLGSRYQFDFTCFDGTLRESNVVSERCRIRPSILDTQLDCTITLNAKVV